ncbi:MAG: biosynthetic arginine decarboxylase [Acidobacteria bacterium]|nr:MAG: biosynthetic arginine decarboxylase [Acidobacteriota bacterium]
MSKVTHLPPRRWSRTAAGELYGIDAWGRGFIGINDRGHIEVGPDDGPRIDLKALVDEVRERGIELPLLLRFSDLLKARIEALHDAFHRAIEAYDYEGEYRGVYPIKVNQDRRLVQDLLDYGRPYHYGLEAGSKPELLAVLAMLDDPHALVVCNGYKDEDYVETALLGSRLGPRIVLVVEKPSELRLIARLAERLGVRPSIGMRARLSTRGAGHWQASGGDRSKFGLNARELLEGVSFLRAAGLLDCFVLLHFHLGSQISSIRTVKDALREAGWLYVNLVRMGAPLAYLDVGGGLGVDYDGSQTNVATSMDYSLQEYANDVVYNLMEVCDQHDVGHPTLVTEAGRATVAHHAVLVTEVLEVGKLGIGALPERVPEEAELVVHNLFEAYHELTPKNARETYHDALLYRDECLSLFKLGHLPLEQRVLAEDIFWAICGEVRRLLDELPRVPEELALMEPALADTYFCNFSVFQSLPDSWAIGQLFPIVPIHRLDERPERHGVLADITCDSDGAIERFIDPRAARSVLDLHEVGDDPYYLGIFLVGAYQEILGDLHNLFGDVNAVHVSRDGQGGYRIDHVVPGNTVTEVLRYVGYHREEVLARLRRSVEEAIRAERLTRRQARELLRRYQKGLAGYTYLERRDVAFSDAAASDVPAPAEPALHAEHG